MSQQQERAFFFFSPQWPDCSLTLDACWTFNSPHTHTHTQTPSSSSSSPYLFWDQTPPSSLRNHPALAPTPRAQVCEHKGHWLTVRQEHLRWVGCAFIDRKCTGTLWSGLPAVCLLSGSCFTQKFERLLILSHVNKPDVIWKSSVIQWLYVLRAHVYKENIRVLNKTCVD